jgi:HSP20 family protein
MSGRPSRGPRSPAESAAWDPLRDLISLKDRMNRLFETVMHTGDFSREEVTGWSPAIDVREDREGFRLTAELPGVRRQDVQVRVEQGTVTLEGDRPADPDARNADHLRVERSYGPFQRSVPLPSPIDAAKVTARMHLGVLEVFLPKASGARAHAIKVRVVD